MNAKLTPEQIDVLLRPIRPGRVATRDGQSNVEAYDIRAHLTRIFGFGNWDEIAVGSRLLYEEPTTTKAGKDAWKVAYSADRCIRVRDNDGNLLCEHHGSAIGEAIMPDFKRGDCHDFALKKAQSQALKRAAINLGDQFGLSLYRKGSLEPLIGKIVGHDPGTHGDGRATTDMHEPDVVEGYDPDATSDDDEPAAVAPVTESPVQPPIEAPHDAEAYEQPSLEDVPRVPDTVFMVADPQIRKMAVLFGRLGIKERDAKLDHINTTLGTNVASSKELTLDQAKQLITEMEAEADRTGRDGA